MLVLQRFRAVSSRIPVARLSTAPKEEEVAKFEELSSGWWKNDRDPLLLMNQLRVPLVKSLLPGPEDGVRVLDVGCGGGYLAEALAKEDLSVTGIDPSKEMIKIAQAHAAKSKIELDLEYRCSMVEDVEGTEEEEGWDVVVSSEVVEHVPCVTSFVGECAKRVKPGGGLMFTTINRTMTSWALAIIAAENIAGYVPPGTHDYHKLVPPQVLTGAIRDCGFEIEKIVGMRFNPLTRQWSKTSDLSVNYAVTARKIG